MIRKRKSRGKNHGKSKNSQNPEIQIIQKFGNQKKNKMVRKSENSEKWF